MASRPLDPIFSPGSIAVVGASRRRDSLGFSLLHNLVVNEFTGAIYPVNPEAKAIHSLLESTDTFRVLDLYGIPLARWRRVATSEEALAAAREIGYPVVLKAVAPDLVHKSDVGAVQVDLRDEGELAEALARAAESVRQAGHRIEGWLVQEMARGGHEVIFGITTDPRYGPLLMFGLGGKYVEVFQDVRFGVLPLGPSDARDMVRGIRGFKLLEGVRGEAGADLDLLTEVLLRLGQLAQRHPRIREVDINPFLESVPGRLRPGTRPGGRCPHPGRRGAGRVN